MQTNIHLIGGLALRIISGMRKGLKLKSPDGMNTRPTTDRVKESVFNLLQFCMPCDSVLDLFAGSGALGIEALSRYSSRAVFVDQNKQSVQLVKDNLSSAQLLDKASFYCQDALSYLRSCSESFDLIFLDPPYNAGLLKPVLAEIAERDLLRKDGIIVVESEENGESVEDSSFFVRRNTKYGKTIITLLQR